MPFPEDVHDAFTRLAERLHGPKGAVEAVRNAVRTPEAHRTTLRPVMCAAMLLAAGALLAAIAFGAPLVSILLVGLLLLCPLFTWVPFRVSRPPGPRADETDRKEPP